MKQARYYIKTGKQTIRCTLCPHSCLLIPGDTGRCRVRHNHKGTLFTRSYGVVSGFGIDPIEKKPLYHYFPGSRILSVGSYGCNLRCLWCQNAHISQCGIDRQPEEKKSPAEALESASNSGGIGLAYTYNEPVVFFEWMMETARLVNDAGLKNVVVTNGYINPEPLAEWLELCHAFNVDLKSFSDEFYRKYTTGSIQPVLNTLAAIAGSGLHLEITFLVIAGMNDNARDFEKMVQWIANTLGTDVVLHINRYFPSWRLNVPATPINVMQRLEDVARKYLQRVYLGNVPHGYRSS